MVEEKKKRGRPKLNKPEVVKIPKKRGRPSKPKPAPPKSTERKPLEMVLDEDGKQHCPECNGQRLEIIDYDLVQEGMGLFRFVKQCKDCRTYCVIEKRV